MEPRSIYACSAVQVAVAELEKEARQHPRRREEYHRPPAPKEPLGRTGYAKDLQKRLRRGGNHG